MVLKLYAAPQAAGGTAIVALTLAEKQVPYELITVNMEAKEHKTPEYLAMHPFGQIPVIDDDGFVLYESRAICRYIAEKYADQGTSLLPKSFKERIIFEQAASVEATNFHPAIFKILMEAVGKSRRGLPVDQAVLDAAVAEFSEKLDVYEVILGKHKFLAGNEFTLADVFHFGYGPMLASYGVDVMTGGGRPNVTRWWNELMARPAWVKLKAEGVKSTQ
ncbi:glutathione S-transferase [Mycena albidolilacea]|uniref:glutathione transferase n=1 Tax=Mycena albidolilacea TaxID=1033008 RepID=A0AAD6ZZ91_9AGAR|nr:glutathione S-transferase [Mycena albidolilacea]